VTGWNLKIKDIEKSSNKKSKSKYTHQECKRKNTPTKHRRCATSKCKDTPGVFTLYRELYEKYESDEDSMW
jgi:hypothetical protein